MGIYLNPGHRNFEKTVRSEIYVDMTETDEREIQDGGVQRIELKYQKTVGTAADQIRARNYPQRLEHYKGKVLLISISYRKTASTSGEYKKHSCKIEEF